MLIDRQSGDEHREIKIDPGETSETKRDAK